MSGVLGTLFGGGAAPFTEAHTITCGYSLSGGIPPTLTTGFNSTIGIGTIDNSSFGLKGGATITAIEWVDSGTQLVFILNGSQTNTGWTSMTLSSDGATYTRASAGYTDYGSFTQWVWTVASNPVNNGETVRVGFI